MNRYLAGLLLVPTLTAIYHCSSSSTKAAPVTIAYVGKSVCNTIFDPSYQGAMLAGQDLNGSGANVTVNITKPDDCPDGSAGLVPGVDPSAVADGGICTTAYSPQQQVLLQQAIDSHASAIAVDVLSPSCVTGVINEAVDAGIPVVTFDADDPASNRTTTYGIDNKGVTETLVDVMATLIGQTGKIAVQTFSQQNPDGSYSNSTNQVYVDRMAGFTEEVAKYPNITVVATLPSVGSTPNDGFAATQVETVMAANPDLKGIVFVRGLFLRDQDLATHAPTYVAARAAGTIKAVSFDMTPDTFANVQAGYMDMMGVQKYFGWGYDVVTLAYNIVTLHEQVPAFTDSGWYAICPNNWDQYISFYNAQNFRSQVAPCQYLPDAGK